MSYAITVSAGPCETCGTDRSRYMDPTYNLSPLFSEALGFPLRKLDGWAAKDCIEPLARAVEWARRYPTIMRGLEPSNGWGSYEGAMGVLSDLLTWCRESPENAVVKVQ